MKMWASEFCFLEILKPQLRKGFWTWHKKFLENFAVEPYVEEQCLRWFNYTFLKDLAMRTLSSGQRYGNLL